MKTYATVGGKGLVAKFKAHPSLIHRTVESVIIQEARALCVEYGSATMPGPGLSDGGNVEAFRRTVESDVRRVFASRANPSQIFRMIKNVDPLLANAYWNAYKREKPREMAAILKKANLPQGLDPADHAAARTGKNGRVKKNQRPVSIANEAQLRVFVRKQRRLVGTAKAGWYCAAKGLGGRVRRNLRDFVGENRKTEEIFPKYVRDLARKFPDLGGARITTEGSRVTVEIFSNVTHADMALSEGMKLSAETRAEEKMNLALLNSVQNLNRRIFTAA